MIIHPTERRIQDGQLIISARVETTTRDLPIPDRLWFSLPEKYAASVTDSLDPFVSALLMVAMHLGEDIEARGHVSARFAYGLETEYQRAFQMWFPEKFRQIRLHANAFTNAGNKPLPSRVLVPLSSGVDSFYTLYTLLQQRQRLPGTAPTHVINVVGFDVLLEDERTWRALNESHASLLAKLGLHYVVMKTNVRHFTDRLMGWPSWSNCFGSILIGCALLLGKSIRRFYFPAGRTYTTGEPVGSLPQIDHALSTETLEIFHHGAGATRVEKTLTVAEWSETYTRLRVCWQNPDGLNNCCRCDKCIRTMIPLELTGKLQHYTTFPLPMDSSLIRERLNGDIERLYVDDLIECARAHRRQDLVDDLLYVKAKHTSNA